MINKRWSFASVFNIAQEKPWAIWSLIGGVLSLLILFCALAILSENKHREVAQLYAQAYTTSNKINTALPYTPSMDKEIDLAVEQFKQVLALDSSFVENDSANSIIGTLLLYKGEEKEALSYLEKMKDSPNSYPFKGKALTLLARLYLKESRQQDAIAIYESLKKNQTGEALNFVLYQLGVLYTSQNKIDQSMKNYSQITAESPLKSLANRNIFILKAVSKDLPSQQS